MLNYVQPAIAAKVNEAGVKEEGFGLSLEIIPALVLGHLGGLEEVRVRSGLLPDLLLISLE